MMQSVRQLQHVRGAGIAVQLGGLRKPHAPAGEIVLDFPFIVVVVRRRMNLKY